MMTRSACEIGSRTGRSYAHRWTPLIAGLWCASLALPSFGDEGIDLIVDLGPGAGDVTLQWTGEAPPFQVYSSVDPATVTDPANQLGDTNDNVWIDHPPPDPIIYYHVVMGCPPGLVFCSGMCTDLDENPTCGGAVNLGTVSGDAGADVVTYSASGETWLRVFVSEADIPFPCIDLSARIRLFPAAGTDYDLQAYCDDCVGADASSNNPGSSVDEVIVRWEEDCFLGIPTGSNSGRDVFVRVVHFDAPVCDNWILQVEGNVSTGPLTCSTK